MAAFSPFQSSESRGEASSKQQEADEKEESPAYPIYGHLDCSWILSVSPKSSRKILN